MDYDQKPSPLAANGCGPKAGWLQAFALGVPEGVPGLGPEQYTDQRHLCVPGVGWALACTVWGKTPKKFATECIVLCWEIGNEFVYWGEFRPRGNLKCE